MKRNIRKRPPRRQTQKSRSKSDVLQQHYNKADDGGKDDSDEHAPQAGFAMEPDGGFFNRADLGHFVELIKRSHQDVHYPKAIPVNHKPQKVCGHCGVQESGNAVDESQDEGE